MKLKILLVFTVIILIITGCEKTGYDYSRYTQNKEVVYTGLVSDFIANPGNLRVQLTWQRSSDPSIIKYLILYNNNQDSLVFLPDSKDTSKLIKILLTGLGENVQDFTLFTYDSKGNHSVGQILSAIPVFGPRYQSGLVNRRINSYTYAEDTKELTVIWNTPDTINTSTTISYIDAFGKNQKFILNPGTDTTTFSWQKKTFIYFQSSYKPTSSSIDTFTTVAKDSLQPAGFEIAKTNWKVIDFSSQQNNGDEGANNGGAVNAIDGDINTYWHTQYDPSLVGPPHYISVDMGEIHTVSGITFLNRLGDNRSLAKNITIMGGADTLIWAPIAHFTLLPTNDLQKVQLDQPAENVRYFKFIIEDMYGDNQFTAVSEISLLE